MTRVRVVVAATVAIVALGLVAVLSESKPRLAQTNNVPPQRVVAELGPGQQVCQGLETVPSGVARLVLRTPPRLEGEFPVAAQVRGGRDVSLADSVGEARAGRLVVDVGSPPRSTIDAEICLTNEGRERLSLSGFPIRGEQAARVDGAPGRGRLAMDYLRPGRESWWELAGTVAHRFGIGKAAFFGDWTLWAALALMAGAWVAALRLVLRHGRQS